jgi:hypothetical protein
MVRSGPPYNSPTAPHSNLLTLASVTDFYWIKLVFGVGSPDGWLWTRMIAAAASRMAGWKSIRLSFKSLPALTLSPAKPRERGLLASLRDQLFGSKTDPRSAHETTSPFQLLTPEIRHQVVDLHVSPIRRLPKFVGFSWHII